MWQFFKPKVPQTPSFEPTSEMIAEARRNPGGWVYQIDGRFGSDEAVPPEHILGAYKVDEKGSLTGEFLANPNYRKA